MEKREGNMFKCKVGMCGDMEVLSERQSGAYKVLADSGMAGEWARANFDDYLMYKLNVTGLLNLSAAQVYGMMIEGACENGGGEGCDEHDNECRGRGEALEWSEPQLVLEATKAGGFRAVTAKGRVVKRWPAAGSVRAIEEMLRSQVN